MLNKQNIFLEMQILIEGVGVWVWVRVWLWIEKVPTGYRIFANMTFDNYWRMSWGYTDESQVEIRQC
jgi:hypothetical protein